MTFLSVKTRWSSYNSPIEGMVRNSMADIISPEKRSALMARIKGVDTQPEMVVRRLLHGLGYRYRLHVRNLPGRPDIVLRRRNAIILVHGCFWHRHHCGRAYNPKSRVAFWQAKFDDNVRRDKKNEHLLTASGWRVLTVWECETKAPSVTELARRLERFLGKFPTARGRNQRLTKRLSLASRQRTW